MQQWRLSLIVFTVLLCFGVMTSTAVQAAEKAGWEENPYAICAQNGWTLVQDTVNGYKRDFFWKAPRGAWTNGAIIVMHGGSGFHHQFCTSSHKLTDAQVRFAELAVQRGFAVFALNSTDKITDTEGRLCGKIWDDEVRDRPNIDVPFIREVITKYIPERRTQGGSPSVFLTGLSSGGYMTVRASTELPDLVTAFAPISNGDPYGWTRDCTPKKNGRKTVHGGGYDNDTGKQIIERNSCDAATGYQKEMPWPDAGSAQKPVFKLFHHQGDGINDFSCNERVRAKLLEHGFPEDGRYATKGWRRVVNHFWLDEYNEPILDFFEKHAQH